MMMSSCAGCCKEFKLSSKSGVVVTTVTPGVAGACCKIIWLVKREAQGVMYHTVELAAQEVLDSTSWIRGLVGVLRRVTCVL